MKYKDLDSLRRKDREVLRLRQLEETIGPFRNLGDPRRPSGGWVRGCETRVAGTGVRPVFSNSLSSSGYS